MSVGLADDAGGRGACQRGSYFDGDHRDCGVTAVGDVSAQSVGAGLACWLAQLRVHLVCEPFRVRLDHRSSQAVAASVVLDVVGEALVLASVVFFGAGYRDKACESGCFSHVAAFLRVGRVAPLSPVECFYQLRKHRPPDTSDLSIRRYRRRQVQACRQPAVRGVVAAAGTRSRLRRVFRGESDRPSRNIL